MDYILKKVIVLEILCRIIMLNHIRLPCTLVQCHVSFIYYVISLKGERDCLNRITKLSIASLRL